MTVLKKRNEPIMNDLDPARVEVIKQEGFDQKLTIPEIQAKIDSELQPTTVKDILIESLLMHTENKVKAIKNFKLASLIEESESIDIPDADIDSLLDCVAAKYSKIYSLPDGKIVTEPSPLIVGQIAALLSPV